MNRNKKIAMAVIATVMAGTMVIPLAACNPDNNDDGGKVDLEKWNVFDANGNINYDAYKRDGEVTLNIAIGHDGNTTSTSFNSGATYTLADGVTYQGGAMKPAWKQMGQDLNITWNDVFVGSKAGQTDSNLNTIIKGSGKVTYEETDMFTSDLSVIVSQISKGTDILNLGDYLDYMPNFKNFLEANPIVYLSLLQDGMSTTDGSGKSLYVAPYFDGNDDIERYCIIRQDWASKILDGDTPLATGEKFSEKCAAKTSVQPYMTGLTSLKVDVTDPTPDENGGYTKDKVVYKNYANVKTQLKTENTPLRNVFDEITNKTVTIPNDGYGGNIVAIMNAAIAANANVTGDKLAGLFRAYVDACYTTTSDGTTSYYAANKRSDLFNGYDAAWDVDDLVAMLRCVMTNQGSLLSDGHTQVFGIAPRDGTNKRTPDMVKLACQLYGARGGESRYEYTYIDNAGNLQDARNDKAFYQAMDNMNKLRQEGLIVDYVGTNAFLNESGYYAGDVKKNNQQNAETFMMYDYCQTQTAVGFYKEGVTGVDVPTGYNFAPVLTPVSKWDVNADGTISDSEYFRFTESWRSTKTSGLALNGGLVNDKAKLKAALQFVDYLYSKDGQIVSTYGPMATNANGAGGFWYNAEATQAQKDAGTYFTYKGVKYAGTLYKGAYTPTVTDAVKDSFKIFDKEKLPETVKGVALSFTNYARMLIGSTLPIGVKDQSFEDQLTSAVGKEGSKKVGAALANEIGNTGYSVIRGLSLNINENDWWYTCVPTSLPVPTVDKPTLDDTKMNKLKYMSGEKIPDGNDNFFSVFNHIILKGTGEAYGQQEQTYTFATENPIDALKTYMSTDNHAQEREDTLALGWNQAKAYWNYLKPKNN